MILERRATCLSAAVADYALDVHIRRRLNEYPGGVSQEHPATADLHIAFSLDPHAPLDAGATGDVERLPVLERDPALPAADLVVARTKVRHSRSRSLDRGGFQRVGEQVKRTVVWVVVDDQRQLSRPVEREPNLLPLICGVIP